MRVLRGALFAIALQCVAWRMTLAQEATVFVRHPLKNSGKKPVVQLEYQLPGERTDERHAGDPPLLLVPQGSQACFSVERANPLLYTYTVGSKILKVETPDTVSRILKQLLALAPRAVVPGQGFFAPDTVGTSGPIGQYAATVGQLFRIRTEMEALKLSSDSASNLVELAKAGIMLASEAADTNTVAEDAYKALSDEARKQMTVRMLRAGQLDQADRAKHLAGEFEGAEGLMTQRLCVPMAKDRVRVTLSIAARSGVGADNLKKMTGDEIASFDAEPKSTAALEFGPGVIFNTLRDRSKSFAVAEGKIVENEGDQLLFRPAILANFRSWGPTWIWGTVGISGNDEGISDLFVGVTGRFGYSIAGARLALGVGLAAARLPTGLTKGAVGEALPADVPNIDKIVKKSLVPGFGIVLMATGF